MSLESKRLSAGATVTRRCLGRAESAQLATVVVLLALTFTADASGQHFGEWGPAVSVDGARMTVNSAVNDGCPMESPDGHTLFFASDRSGNLDIWVAYRATENGAWESPEPLPGPVNTPASEFCPTALPGDRLLFVSTRGNACGGAGNNPDIYLTRRHPVRGWLSPEHLGCDVNSGFEEFSPSLVEAEGQTMLFFSSNRGDGIHHGIYVSVLDSDGLWGTPTPVDELNAAGAQDARPNVRKDGLEIVFDSTRGGGPPEIYAATRASVFDAWSAPEALSTSVNSAEHAETRASISRDGERLYFGSTRANQSGDRGADIFVSDRSSGPRD